jgi:hypothetical protein
LVGPIILFKDKADTKAGTSLSTLADGTIANFRCHGANIWPTYVVSILAPTVAIWLHRE